MSLFGELCAAGCPGDEDVLALICELLITSDIETLADLEGCSGVQFLEGLCLCRNATLGK